MTFETRDELMEFYHRMNIPNNNCAMLKVGYKDAEFKETNLTNIDFWDTLNFILKQPND